MANSISAIKTSSEAFLSILLQCPATVAMKSFNVMESRELETLLASAWMKWKREVYLRLKLFGICPWYFERVAKTIHKIPVVPPRKSGTISTYMDKRHHQRFKWRWNGEQTATKMYFEVREHPPSIFGEYTSSVIPLLNEYRSVKLVRDAKETAWFRQARPQHILEYRPSSGNITDTTAILATQELSGEAICGTLRDTVEPVREMRITKVQEMIRKAEAANSIHRNVSEPYLRSEKARLRWEQQHNTLLSNMVPLTQDFYYKQVPPPRVNADLSRMIEQLEARAAMVSDIPKEVFSGNSKTTQGAQNEIRFVNERIKNWINYLQDLTKRVLLLIYGKFIQKDLDALDRFYLVEDEIKVTMQCSPFTSYADLRQFVNDGIMSKETMARRAFESKGLPEDDITLGKVGQLAQIKRSRKQKAEENQLE